LIAIGLDVFMDNDNIYKEFAIVDERVEFVVGSDAVIRTGEVDWISIYYDPDKLIETRFFTSFSPSNEEIFDSGSTLEFEWFVRYGNEEIEYDEFIDKKQKYFDANPGLKPTLILDRCRPFDVMIMPALSII
ncbi:MAG: hypothetical protein WAX04_13320, partial [Oscillospiraceae bacterium]